MTKLQDSLKKRISGAADIAKTQSKKMRKSLSGMVAHKHCRMCHVPIDLKAEPPICASDDCDAKWSSEERNRKQLKLWMTIFIAIFAFSFLGPLVAQLVM